MNPDTHSTPAVGFIIGRRTHGNIICIMTPGINKYSHSLSSANVVVGSQYANDTSGPGAFQDTLEGLNDKVTWQLKTSVCCFFSVDYFAN